MTTAFVLVDVDPSRIEELATAIADVDGVESVWSVTGADADLVVLVQVPAVDDVATVVTHHIARLDGIRKTRTAVAFREYAAAARRAEGLEAMRDRADRAFQIIADPKNINVTAVQRLVAQQAVAQARLEYARARGEAWRAAAVISGLTLEEAWPPLPQAKRP